MRRSVFTLSGFRTSVVLLLALSMLLVIGSCSDDRLPADFYNNNPAPSDTTHDTTGTGDHRYSAGTYTVREDIDGDTVILSDGRHIRLVGVNTTEINHDDTLLSEPYALAGRHFTDSVATGRHCRLEWNIAEGDTLDMYGRTLAFLWLIPDDTHSDSVMINLLIMQYGWSDLYEGFPMRDDYKLQLRALNTEARTNHRGMFAGGGR